MKQQIMFEIHPQYNSIVKIICGDNWNTNLVSEDEQDGGLGIAIILAYLKGTPPRINDLSRSLGVTPNLLESAYKRLQENGLLSNKSWVTKDKSLIGLRNSQEGSISLCWIAGIASGFTGKSAL